DWLIAHKGWRVDQNTQIIVFPQQGTSYFFGTRFCGVHAFDSTATHSGHYAYALVEFGAQNHRCDYVGNPTGDMIWNAVHEYTEMVTDPQIFGTLGTNPPFFGALGAGWHVHDSRQSTPQ